MRTDVRGLGWAEIDTNGDQIRDVVLGVPSNFTDAALHGLLSVYSNSDGTGRLALAEAEGLEDDQQAQIDMGANAWPLAYDWDGDEIDDLLIANQSGGIAPIDPKLSPAFAIRYSPFPIPCIPDPAEVCRGAPR